ncbi:MAG TPA: sugar ABC transporter permease [Clostridiales bacterium]|nr:sugar ABC transporter permease [Clostridiales bacterium]
MPTAATLLFFRALFDDAGLANSLLTHLGIPVISWLMYSYAFWVLVLLYLWKNLGFNIILFLSALNSVPKEYYEAVEMDGASKSAQFFKITLPLIFPHLFFILIWSILYSFKAFREAFLLCGNHPHSSIYMIQHFLNNNFANLNYVRLSSAAMTTFLVIFMLVAGILLFRREWGDTEL